jgi:hypothetical protein
MAAGKTTFLIVCHFVAPQARDASLKLYGTALIASSEVDMIYGSTMMARVNDPASKLIPKLKATTKTARPKSPKTTEGTPASVYIDIITILSNNPGFEYSDRKIAVVTPIGITTIMQSVVSNIVPTITGKMPPFVIASIGGCVTNSQLKMLMPL